MVALVQKIYREADPMQNPFRSQEKIRSLRVEQARVHEPKAQLDLRMQIALQLLQAGHSNDALRELDALDEYLREVQWKPDPALEVALTTRRAVCHLRAAETANCVANHNADSCLFPIQGGGVHKSQDESRAAISILTQLLAKYPGNLEARWLLNIAYMTVGEYPEKVPPRSLIAPELLSSAYEINRFPDVAAHLGLDADGLAGGVVLDDFDLDGFLDVMVSSSGFEPRDQLRVFRNNGDGTFAERTGQAGIKGLVGGLNLRQGDFNNDGFVDIVVLRGAWLGKEGHYPFSLLRNNGDFTFTDVTESAGMLHFKPTQTAEWLDFNGDGWLDLFVANESSTRDPCPCELYRNNGDGTFTECAAECGLDLIGFFKGVVACDFNNDGQPDLFLSDRAGALRLLRNDGPAGSARPSLAWKFTNVAEAAGIDGPASSFPCWSFDYDNDGWDDLMVTGYSIQDLGDVVADYLGRPTPAPKARLYRNNHDGTFTNVSRAAGVSKVIYAMGANFGDLDNDGWLDFYCGTGDPDFATLLPNRMFRNDSGRAFQEVTTSGGFGMLQKGHGVAFGDIDNDGDQDVYAVVGGAAETDNYPNQLFLNPGHGNHWLTLRLEGVQSNRVAIGARLRVVINDGGRERSLYRTIGPGASFGGNPLRQEIGIGTATTIVRVEVRWPASGQIQILTGFEADHFYRIQEFQQTPECLPHRSFLISPGPSASVRHHHLP